MNRLANAGDAGREAIDKSALVFRGIFETVSILPPRCIRNVRSDVLRLQRVNRLTVSTISVVLL